MLFEKIRVLTELNNDLMHAATLNLQYRPDLLSRFAKPINDYLDKSQTLNDLATYCVETSSKDKIQYVVKIMENTLKGHDGLIECIKNTSLVNRLKEHSSRFGLGFNKENRTQGEILKISLIWVVMIKRIKSVWKQSLSRLKNLSHNLSLVAGGKP